MDMLWTRGLHASYGHTNVLVDVDLSVAEGSVVALLGANGAGKTTLLRSLSQLGVVTRGEIWLQGRRIDGSSTESIARRGVAHVPDDRGTFVQLSVEDNLSLGMYGRGSRRSIGVEQVYGYFPRLRERRRQLAGTLSGGEQQMLAISRALLLSPRLLLLDEPSFGIAPIVVEEIFQILRKLNREHGLTILLAEQNVRQALAISNRAYLMAAGQVVLEGPADLVATDENIQRAYLGA